MEKEAVRVHELAQELNDVLAGTAAGALLSMMGRRLYFPKGIIAQGAEAKQHSTLANGTLGIAIKNKSPLILSALKNQIPGLGASDIVSYAPTAGLPALREFWAQEIKRKNPSLANVPFSLPVVVTGLTAGVSAACDLFLEHDGVLFAANPSWDNYALIAETRHCATLRVLDMFGENGMDLDVLQKAFTDEAKRTGLVRVILNFPQNPTGYSPTKREAQELCSILLKLAATGARVLVMCDDAYYGLRYEDDIEPQSLFAYLANLHEKILAVKIDGATKEDFAWGLRCGFITYAGKGLTPAHYDALIKKTMSTVRSTISCSSTVTQSLLYKMYTAQDGSLQKEREEYKQIIQNRYKMTRAIVDKKRDHPVLRPLAFNSGYFMSFTCAGVDAEKLRQKLLHEYGVGTIAINAKTLRVAFSGMDDDCIAPAYDAIYKAAEELANK